MDNQVTLTSALDKLDYSSSPSLILREDSKMVISEELEVIWNDAKEKLEVDAVYFLGIAPVIYFKRFEALDPKAIADFHRNVWNQSQVPLIIVVLPTDIRVYSGYEAPTLGLIEGLGEPTRLEIAFNPNVPISSSYLWERLKKFTRDALESGSLWRDYSEYFRKETRVDQVLLANLRYVRQELIKRNDLPPEHAHSLIGRSIFALYLQDRDVLSIEEPNFFAERYNNRYRRYTDLLISYEDTYDFFEFLHKRFNGDMFPVTEEEKELVDDKHLAILRDLFTIDRQAGGQMLFFWAYNFKFIPIELISSIYEEFLHLEEEEKNGAYYTPPMLVDFVLNVALPWTDTNYKLSILDPACGSGIFLVEAYRRLVERWRKAPNHQKPLFKDLSEILTTSVFGVDIQRQALRVAAFSLYLAMLDYLEPKSIWLDVTFPPLIGTNLIIGDFFDKDSFLSQKQFDLIVGNPPWQSKLTEHAIEYLDQNKLNVGDKQIAQAFLLHAPDFCTPDGQIALLCSSKSLLFNKSGTNVSFRQRFFRQFSVKAVFDFSVWRRSLFVKAIAPTAAIFFTRQRPDRAATILYGAPKLTYLARLLSAIVIESNDLKQLPLQQVLDSADSMERRSDRSFAKQDVLFPDEEDEEPESRSVNIWKVALWGTSYDYILLQSLTKYPSLQEVIDQRGWYSKGGFNRTGPKPGKPCKWLDNALFLDAKDFTRYGIDTERLKTLPEGDLYYRGGDERRFKAPLVLFKRGQAQRRPSAAYLDIDCTYTDAITGVAAEDTDGERNFLKALTALLNSELAQYYLFLTAASWGVEREEIKAGELRALPFPFLDVSIDKINAIASLVKRLTDLSIKSAKYKKPRTRGVSKDAQRFFNEFTDETKYGIDEEIKRLERLLNSHIYECFHLSEQEIQFIRETVEYTIDFFNSPEKSLAQREPTIGICRAYAEAYIRSINFYLQPIGKRLVATIYYEDGAPLLAIQFTSLMPSSAIPDIQIVPPGNIREVLVGLGKLSNEALGTKMYYRRNFRFYDKETDSLTIAKPPERRLWTTSAALSDAEVTIIEMSQPTQPMRV
jgi:type I restriction-modification system DNA methylase subunit